MKARAGLWLLLGAVICIIVIILGLFLLVFPQRNKANELQKEIDDVKANIQAEQNRLNKLRQYEKDPEQFTRQIEVLKQRIPDNIGLAEVIGLIDHAAEEAGMDFYSFTPTVPQAVQNYYVMTCEVTLNGRYFNLVEFFNQIERLPRSVKVVKLSIGSGDKGLPYIQANVTFRVFFSTNAGVEALVQQGG